ncbi:MAG: chorismate pyruvate-lyase family protein [Gammaproteobacteria bacterium]|nr:chorismate pyruvate-lyase family protein [Gammaproteobacteria bacterium]
MTGIFRAQQQCPPALETVDPALLSPYQRVLLVIDGTVTRFLEAYFAEPIVVTLLAQDEAKAAADAAWLDCAADDIVLRRSVLLIGENSGSVYAWADSVIQPQSFTTSMRDGLVAEPGGLGQILRDSGLETRRDALWFGRERPAEIPQVLRDTGARSFLSRTYRIISGGRPLMMITERFPLET